MAWPCLCIIKSKRDAFPWEAFVILPGVFLKGNLEKTSDVQEEHEAKACANFQNFTRVAKF